MNRLIAALLAALFRRLAQPHPRPRPERVRSVLLVSTTGLGDTIISTGAVALAGQAWPEARLHLLVHQRWAALFTACPRLASIIPYPGKFKGVAGLVRRLRAIEPDLALVLHHNDPDVLPLVWLSRARHLVCREGTRFPFLLDTAVPLTDPRRHIAERRQDVVRAVAGDLPSLGLELFLPDETRAWAEDFWRRAGIAPEERLIALNPGGSRQAKQWPAENWIALLRSLDGRPGSRTALLGSPAEEPAMRALREAAGRPNLPLVAQGDVLRVAGLLARASALVGPDSGLAHMAAALGVPEVVIFGPDNPILSGPLRNRAPAVALGAGPEVCPDLFACHLKTCAHRRCLTAVTPERVIKALAEELHVI